MTVFIETLEAEFQSNTNEKNALKQKAYMRNQFEFYGLSATERRTIQKPFLLKEFRPNKSELEELIKILWTKPQREYQLFAMDLLLKYVKEFEKEDIALLEYMVTNKSWWDTVDMIAVKLMGAYFKKYPEARKHYVEKWLESQNIWLQRSALLFQLKYKKELDTELLSLTINSLLGSKEFFINKAIGWVLREYSRTDAAWVIEFVHKTELSGLSRKEALRLIK